MALLLAPGLVGQLLFGAELAGVAATVARVAGIAIIGLSIACWPGPPRVAMLTYARRSRCTSLTSDSRGLTGILLWPAVFVHVILTALLVCSSTTSIGRDEHREWIDTTTYGETTPDYKLWRLARGRR